MPRPFHPKRDIAAQKAFAENIWDEIREKIFKNYALKSMSDVNAKLDEASLYIEHSSALVRSITYFPYIAKSY
jgi:hypothetical protein